MSKRSKRRKTKNRLPIPVWAVGLLGIILVTVGLIVLTEQRGVNPNPLPYPNVPRISPAEAHSQQQAGSALIVDVRDAPFYQESHAAGAISLPEDEILTRLDELPTDKALVLY